jgi:hypothetical protein
MSGPALILASELPGAGGGLGWAAAAAVALAEAGATPSGVVLAELGASRGRGPTMLASTPARELERSLAAAGFEAAARGRLAWVPLADEPGWPQRLADVCAASGDARAVVAFAEPDRWREALGVPELRPTAALMRAELPRQRSLAALTAIELRTEGLRLRIATRPLGRVASRRAMAGIDPGGVAGTRARRLAKGLGGRTFGPAPPSRRAESPTRRRLAAESGQSLPLVLGGALALIFCTLILAAFGGAVSGKSRVQRAADLAALSAARSMRDEFDRLFVPATRADGSENPAHLDKDAYLDRARAAALEAAQRNGVHPGRLRLEFPDGAWFAPVRIRAEIRAEFDAPAPLRRLPVAAAAEAEAVPPSPSASAEPPGAPSMASGGGYSGPLAYRQGEPMRPDVAAAFDRMAAAARAAGVSLIVNSGFRSDAEQAALFAANPDPQWVAPPGQSLHRCATELDLGPPPAYSWLAAHAKRFGFVKRYSWEPWHFGFVEGPPPCSSAGDSISAQAGSGEGEAETSNALPEFVPARFREPIARAAARWNVSAALLAAQLMAESNFNPFAVSPAGAQGIAQFMPGTAAAYELDDPLDPVAAIDAQAHLMSDLLRRFDGEISLALAAYNAGPAPVAACGCVPSYPETQAYVARILGLMNGAGAIAAPVLEVRLVE